MLVAILFCSSILSANPGCREVRMPLYDTAANEISCTMKAQEVIVDQQKLYPDARPVRWGCRRRKGATGENHA